MGRMPQGCKMRIRTTEVSFEKAGEMVVICHYGQTRRGTKTLLDSVMIGLDPATGNLKHRGTREQLARVQGDGVHGKQALADLPNVGG